MATRSKSSSGAYMSQYDNEVEKRLQALEAQAHEKCDGGDVDGYAGDDEEDGDHRLKKMMMTLLSFQQDISTKYLLQRMTKVE